jgi:hypothetical protein
MASTAANAFTSIDYIALVFKGIYFSASESVPKEMTVTSVGIGDTQDIAIQNALNISVQKAIGVLIVSDQTVNNDRLIRNLVAQYSSGVVNSYEVKKCSGKPISCEVTAKVSPWKFMRKLEGDSQTMQVNGNDLLMKHQTAKNTLIQRYKLTEYYMSQIRQSGLDVIIRSVNVEPSVDNMVRLQLQYEVKWNKEFKTELLRFLEKLEKDTVNNDVNHQVYIQWGPTGFFENRVRINTYNEHFRNMMMHYIYQPTHIQINELGICDDIQSENVFTVDWYGVKRTKTVFVAPEKLKGIQSLSARLGCGKI